MHNPNKIVKYSTFSVPTSIHVHYLLYNAQTFFIRNECFVNPPLLSINSFPQKYGLTLNRSIQRNAANFSFSIKPIPVHRCSSNAQACTSIKKTPISRTPNLSIEYINFYWKRDQTVPRCSPDPAH